MEEKSMEHIFSEGKYKYSQREYHTKGEDIVLDPIILYVPFIVGK